MGVDQDQPGYAGIPTFLRRRLVLDASGLQGVDVAIVGAPVDDLVTYRPGARFGPRAIRIGQDEGSRIPHLDLGVDPLEVLEIVDHGDAEVVPMDPEASHRAIRDKIAGVVAADAVPILLGGDHSISFPSISAVSDAVGADNLAVVQFDTHADTASANWGNKWAHGTPFRNLVDRGFLRGRNLVQVGLRGYWPNAEEFDWARDRGIKWHRMDEVFERGIDAVIADVIDSLTPPNVYLSVDIDVLDPAFAPGTGTPEPGGMTTRELFRAVRSLASSRSLVGMDVVEVAPAYDHAAITALAAHRVVIEALAGLALYRRGRQPSPQESKT